MLETPVQQRARITLAQLGALPQRNNVGACQDATGRLIRYGLMNESKAMNERIKSSDLIAPVPVRITADMVGKVIGVYGAFETKATGWRLTPGDQHGHAQAEYHRVIIAHGGMAGFVQSDDDVRRIIAGFNGLAT